MTPFPGFTRAHFVGIGGAGMSGLAEVMHSRGFAVSGSDLVSSSITEHLSSLGIQIVRGHNAVDKVNTSDVVVYSSAVPRENPELRASLQSGIPVVRRASMLGEMMKKKWTLAVSGTHGKTTATLMIGSVWQAAGLDPTVIGGGVLQGKSSGVTVGQGPYLIAEADEYDKSFLEMYPTVLVITNIDTDHLDCYGGLEQLKTAFIACAAKIPFCGFTVVNTDDPGVAGILADLPSRKVTYGFGGGADYRADGISTGPDGISFVVHHKGKKLSEVSLGLYGKHNISNALGVFALAHSLDVAEEHIVGGLKSFPGTRRRIELLGEAGGVRFLDDYAHHPAEVNATLKTVREAFGRRTVVVFQPHLYSRTKLLWEDFSRSLLGCDELFVTSVYPAREQPMDGVEGNLIADGARKHGHPGVHFLEDRSRAAADIAASLKPGDLLLTMGAGDIWKIAREVMSLLEGK